MMSRPMPDTEAILTAAGRREPSPPWLVDLAAAAALTVVLMAALLASGGVWGRLGGTDLHGAFLPKYAEAARALFQEGRLPLWNPYEFCGEPLFAVIQGLVLYFPVPILFALLPSRVALQSLYALHFLLLAFGILVYLRHHGIHRLAAAVAVPIAISGVFTSFARVGFDHPNFVGNVAWIPWMFLCFEKTLQVGVRPWLGLFALAFAGQWFAGYPEFGMDTSILLVLFAAVVGGSTLPRRVGLALVCLAVGGLLAAVQLLPLAEAVGQSHRVVQEGGFWKSRFPFSIISAGQLQGMVLARFGVATLLLGMVGVASAWSARPLERTRLAWLVVFLWATFAVDPPLNLIYELPVFVNVRYPFGWGHIAPLFLGFLAAAGVAAALRNPSVLIRAIAVVLALGAGAKGVYEVWYAPRTLTWTAPDYELLEQRTAILEEARRRFDPPPRLVSIREQDTGMTLRKRLPTPTGYDPTMPPARVKRMLLEVNRNETIPDLRAMAVHSNSKLASLMGVGLIAVPRSFASHLEKEGFERVATLPPRDVVLYRDSVPRARIVHSLVVTPDSEESFARTVDPSRDFLRTAVIESDTPAPEVADPPADAIEQARIVVDEPERVEIEAQLAAPGVLVLTDTYYPGWEATVDGEPAPILRADYAFRAIALPAGSHRIAFRYAPRSLRIGFLLTVLSAFGVAALVLTRPRRI